jgi:hypothetical protein
LKGLATILYRSIVVTDKERNHIPGEEIVLLPVETTRILKSFCLPGYNAVKSVERQPTFWRNMSPPSSQLKRKPSKKSVRRRYKQACCLLHAGFLLGLVSNPGDLGDMFLRNVF